MARKVKPYFFCGYCSNDRSLVLHDTVACPKRSRGPLSSRTVPREAKAIEVMMRRLWFARMLVGVLLPVWFCGLTTLMVVNGGTSL